MLDESRCCVSSSCGPCSCVRFGGAGGPFSMEILGSSSCVPSTLPATIAQLSEASGLASAIDEQLTSTRFHKK